MSEVSVNHFTLPPVSGERSVVASRPEPKEKVATKNPPPVDTFSKDEKPRLKLGHARTQFAVTGAFADTWGLYSSR